MKYSMQASVHRPASIIFLVDASARESADSTKQRASIGSGLIQGILSSLMYRCMRQKQILPGYRMAILAYAGSVVDVTVGFQTIDALAKESIRVPVLEGPSQPALAFEQALKILEKELPDMKPNPAPVVCHLSSGRIAGPDPRPFADSVKWLKVEDGSVLVVNVLLSQHLPGILSSALGSWKGVLPDSRLPDENLKTLRDLSSTLPAPRLGMLREVGFQLDPKALMLFPPYPDLVSMAFPMTVTS